MTMGEAGSPGSSSVGHSLVQVIQDRLVPCRLGLLSITCFRKWPPAANEHTHAHMEGRAGGGGAAAGRWDADADDGGGGPEAVWCRLQVYVLKRPYVDEFLQRMGELFECVLFTASLAKVSSCLAKVNRSWGLSVGSRT